MIHFCLIANKQAIIRLKRVYHHIDKALQAEQELAIIRKCLSRANNQCNYFYHESLTIVYKKFTNLCFICAASKDENELALQEVLNVLMNGLNAYFNKVSELDIVYNCDKAYAILDEIIVHGCIAYTSMDRVLLPLQLLETHR